MEEFLKAHGYKGVFQGFELNQYSTRPITFKAIEKEAIKWNEIYKACINSDLNILERGPKGSIKKNINNMYAYDVRKSSVSGTITISLNGYLYAFKLGHKKETNSVHLTSYQAFEMFSNKCKEMGIDLALYKVENGAEIKESIPKPMIIIFPEYIGKNVITQNVHHIDFHSSYASGLVNAYPEFKPVVEFFYNGRDEHPEYKDVLNYTIGYMQSLRVKTMNAMYAKLSKAAIEDNNKRMTTLTQKLAKNGRIIIGYNTDGIWYQGPIYHGEGEGKELGQWSNDHIDCTFRAKSIGAYEFVDGNGNYDFAMRGYTKLDQIKPRKEWKWGDIFKTSIEVLIWDDEEGFIKNE